jgi:cobalamin biosynthetic protein CobC
MALIHGGQLLKIAEQYKIPMTDWLDLSTGIAPISYPIPNIPTSVWQQLPQQCPKLIATAKEYYQCSQLLVTNGSQAIIKALPELYRKKNAKGTNVYIPDRGYKEHAQAWKVADYKLHYYQASLPEISELQPNSVLVIINPNNPTGRFFSRDVINQYHEKLKQLNGLLVLDEAFIDVIPDNQSYCPAVALYADESHIIVLRSFGKFFGLAGIRIGFLVANKYWCQLFAELLGPWQVNGPAQTVAMQALGDKMWQGEQRSKLKSLRVKQEAILWQVFTSELVSSIHGCDLFLTLNFHHGDSAKKLYHLLCKQGVYCRLSDEQDTLRFGITNKNAVVKLESACLFAKAALNKNK